MKLLSILSSALLAISSVAALAADTSVIERDTSTLETRNIVQTGGINVWTSRNNQKIQFRLLGGLRVVQQFYDAFTGHELEMSKAFFTDFIQKNPRVFRDGGAQLRDFTALYKGGNNAQVGVVGLQFEWLSGGGWVANEAYQRMVDMVTSYFYDNNQVRVNILPVADAFNIGGPLMMEELKKRSGGAVIARDACSTYDFVSAFRNEVEWDPDQAIRGQLMCEVPQTK